MDSSLKPIFKLRFNDKVIQTKFDLDESLSIVILKAKELFSWPDEESYTISIEGKEQDEELLLRNLYLQQNVFLDLVRKTVPPDDVATFSVTKDNREFDCPGSLLKPIGEALKKFFKSQDFNLSHYQLFINEKEIQETTILSDFDNPQDLVVDLRKKLPAASDSQDRSDQENQIEEKEIFFTVNSDEISIAKHLVNWLAPVKFLKVEVAEKFSIPIEEYLQVWLVDDKELDDTQPLNKQITSPEIAIQIDIRHFIRVQIDLKGEKIEKTIAINLNVEIKMLKTQLENELQMSGADQAWYLDNMEEQLRDNAKLCEYIENNCSSKPKILIKKLLNQRLFHENFTSIKNYYFQYQNLLVTRAFPSNESVATVLSVLKQRYNIKTDAQIQCKYQDVVMNPNKRLDDFIEEPSHFIILEDCSLKISLMFQGKPFLEFNTENDACIEDIKQQACRMKSIEYPHLYSLKLRNNVLKPSHPLRSIVDFKEDSILELCTEIEINFTFLKNQQFESFSLCIDSNIKIEDLKKKIQASQLIINQEFDLVLNSQRLEESKSLSQYLERDSALEIRIEEKSMEKSHLLINFNKIPENQVYSVCMLKDESFENLTSLLSKEFEIDSYVQVWSHEGDIISDQKGWNKFLSGVKDKNEVEFDVFECGRPHEQNMRVIKIQKKNISQERVRLNLLKPVSTLKKEVASSWKLQENQKQVWKVSSKDLRDDIPFAAQYKVSEGEDVYVIISAPRDFILICNGVESQKSLDTGETILDLKGHLFGERIIEIKPESQVWSFENSPISALEDDKELSFYLDRNESQRIVVRKKAQLIRLQYHKSAANLLTSIEIEGDIDSEVKVLKNVVLGKLGLQPREQFWMLGEREMVDTVPLKEYVSLDELHFVIIDIYPNKDFTLNIVEKNAKNVTIKLTLPLIASVSKIIEKMIQKEPAYRNAKIILQAYGTTLDENKSLFAYSDIWESNSVPMIQATKARRLTITLKELRQDFYFGIETTIQSLESEICERFLILNHELYFLKDGRPFSKHDFSQLFQNGEDIALTVKKMKKCTFFFEDFPENKEEVFKRNSEVYFDEIEEEIKKQIKFQNQNLRFWYKKQLCTNNERLTLDDIDSESFELNFTVQMIKELEIYHNEQRYLVEYIPSETAKDIKLKLQEKGFQNVTDFSLQKDEKVLPDRKTLGMNGITYGKHILFTKRNLQVIVLTHDEEEVRYICGDEFQTVANLKQKIQEKDETDVAKKILILLEEGQWVRRLIKDEEELEGLAAKGETTIRVLCKLVKKFYIAIGLQGKGEIFHGILNSPMEEQKKLIELDYKISVNSQIWTVTEGIKFEPLNEEIIEKGLRNDTFSRINPIRIFRKINLTVCLIDKKEILENLPTYETIREQKDRIALRIKVLREEQRWSYHEEELQDDDTLEEYFKQKSDVKNALEPESFAVDLIILTDLEYYGFTDQKDINVDLFKNFFLESDEDLNRIVASVTFNKKDDSFQFRNKVLGLFFGTLKKHSLWEGLIGRIQKKMWSIKGVNLWTTHAHEKKGLDQSKFNTQFLLYYFLNSGTSELNIEILKIMRMHFPVPLAIKTWSNRFSVEKTKIVNDLYWIVQKGFFIASFGYGDEENSRRGKTKLNNKILSSNFVTNSERNSICKGCPEILFDIYQNDKFPINVIDIPSGTEKELQEKILSCSNMLIVHSFEEEDNTRKFLDKLQLKIPIIILYRDVQDAFNNISKFKADLTQSLNRALENDFFQVKIMARPNYENSNELDYLAEKIHEFILGKFKGLGEKDKELWKFTQFFENHHSQINAVFEKIREKSSQIVQVVPKFAELYMKQNKQMKGIADDQTESKRDLKEIEGIFLSPELNDVLQLLKSENLVSQKEETSHLLIEKFQEYLRMMKSQQTMDFYKLYEFKSKFSDRPEHLDEKIINQFASYWEIVKNQQTYYREMNFDPKTARTKGLEFIRNCIQIFEQKLTPNIFSIELFWRELIYQQEFLQRIGEPGKSSTIAKPIYSLDFLVNMKKENILKGFPFEIIDGDLLHMPKEFLKNVFRGMNDRVIVISVLGPQSSGKSTLLNFLFGCNFVTSSGRCTKGVYGTYFKVSNINSCDGILVLDTEGLFGLYNSKEDQRDKFDRKLVLFCLAMSDIVLVNFKGDIDRNLTQVMMVCKDSLMNLQQGNIQKPEMYLILNQNSQTNRDTQLQDIDKMVDLGFKNENIKILPLAFDTKKEKISTIERYMDLATKKTPKEDFSEQCRLITQEIFEKINYNGNKNVQRTLESTMDAMEHLWELLDKFPDLLRHGNMHDQDQEKKIKDWIEKEVDDGLKRRVSQIAKVLKDSDKIKLDWEKDFREKFTEEEKSIKLNFTSGFKDETEIHLFEDLEKVLYTHIDRIKLELENELNIQSHYEKIKVCDSQGIEKIREEAYKLRNQDKSEKEKEDRFEEVWKEYIEKFEKFYDREKESKNLFQTVRESYKTTLHQIAGLPNSKLPEKDNKSLEDYKKFLLERLKRIYHTEKRFEYTKQCPALIFNDGKSNVSFKYFDLRPFFRDEEFCENFGILKSKIFEIFDIPKIQRFCSNLSEYRAFQKESKEFLVKKIISELSQYGIWASESALEYTLDFYLSNPQKFISRRRSDEYVQHEELKFFGFEFMTETPHSPLKYVDYLKLKACVQEFQTGQATNKSFLYAVLKDSIKWSALRMKLKEKTRKNFDFVQCRSLIDTIQDDLAQINLQFRDYSQSLQLLWYSEEHKIKYVINQSILQTSRPLASVDLNTMNFKFFNKGSIQRLLQKVEDPREFFILQQMTGEKRVVHKDYQRISWLTSYANDDHHAVFQNTMEDKNLAGFIASEFLFDRLIIDLFNTCSFKIESLHHWNSIQIYQEIARETNDLIGVANNDLQQVSCRLDYKLVGEIHLCIVHLLWKYFEEKNWKMITKPLEDLKNRKEQQKEFFKMVASSDGKQNNKAEAQTTSLAIEGYLKKIVQNESEKILKSSVENFKRQTKRSQIQEELDEKFFSRNSVASRVELYSYIVNPRIVILNTYNEISQDFCQDLKRQVLDLEKPFNRCRLDLITRFLKIQSVLSRFEEDTWALHNVFEFKQVQIQSQDEVLMKKYHDTIAKFYYQIVFAFLEGKSGDIFKEYYITSDLKIVMKRMTGLEVPPLENENILELLKCLKSKFGKVTNARLFIDSLLEETTRIKLKLDEFAALAKESFINKNSIFVCKQKCPCCDRICGEDDPGHMIHKCLYGHQIRAIGGTMIPKTKEASIVRCEDISDLDKMKFNGKDMSWGEFKEKMRTEPNNPWSFDDIVKTRSDINLKKKFAYAWSQIGQRICEERHKGTGMVYVPFNQATIDAQREKSKAFHYIFMIDSSGSMIGPPWKDLKASLKKSLGRIVVSGQHHRVSLINFSWKTSIEYEEAPANVISVDTLGFFWGSTNFSKAFAAAFELVRKTKQNDIALIFMTDGGAAYPAEEVGAIKEYLASEAFLSLNITFSFDAIVFNHDDKQLIAQEMFENFVQDLGGKSHFAFNETELTNTYAEILNKNLNANTF